MQPLVLGDLRYSLKAQGDARKFLLIFWVVDLDCIAYVRAVVCAVSPLSLCSLCDLLKIFFTQPELNRKGP